MGGMRGSRNFRQGGPGQSDKKKSSDKVPEGVQHFPGGSNFFQGGGGGGGGGGGSNCLFPIETHITCDFPGGSRPPVPPPSGSALGQIQRGMTGGLDPPGKVAKGFLRNTDTDPPPKAIGSKGSNCLTGMAEFGCRIPLEQCRNSTEISLE